MAYLLFLAICLTFVNSAISQSAYVNVSMSSAFVKLGESFNITVDFYPSTFAEKLETLKCGYETSSIAFADFVEYSLFRTRFELISTGFPAAYVGRLTIPSPKRLTISNVKFTDEGAKYHCELKHNLGPSAQILNSNKVNLTTVYTLPVFSKKLSAESVVIEGRNTSLNCIVRSRPVSAVTWSYDSGINAVQSNSSSVDGDYIDATGMLKIINASSSLNGKTVTCTGTPVYGSPINSTTTLNVLYLPKNTVISISPSNPKQNEIITINCSADAKPVVTNYHFYINDTFLGNATSGVFKVNATQCSASTGIYRCSPSNSLGAANITKSVLVTAPVKIAPQLSSITVNETQNVTLNCSVTGCPAPSVTWTKKGTSTVIGTGNDLSLTSVTNIDAATYLCFADNGVTNASSEAVLTVNYRPISTVAVTATLKPVVNSQVMINCTTDAVPAPIYVFYQAINSSDFEVSSANSRTNGVLIIPSITLLPGTYSRIYKCVPYNMLGKGAAKNLVFDVQVPPNVTATMSPSMVNASGSATLQCAVTGANPRANLTGHDAAGNPIALVNGTAQITNVTRGSSGKFSCRADNGVGSPVIKYAELFVNHRPESVSLTASSLKPVKGDSVTLNCTSTATPEAKYRFYIMKNSNFTEILNNGSGLLTINNINYVEAGSYLVTYRCIPYNFLGDGETKELKLDIQVPPQLEVTGNVTVNEGGEASFNCTVTAANPAANISWWKENMNSRLTSNETLRITSITRQEAGRYYCKAENGVSGSPVTKSVTLTVNFAPVNGNLTSNTKLTVTNGTGVTLTCTSLAVPAAEYFFYEIIGGISKMVSSVNSQSTGVLQIASINTDTSTYKTSYKCAPRNAIGNGTMQQLDFSVQVPPSAVMITPDVHTHTITEGKLLNLSCSVAYGNPRPTIAWTSSVGSDSFSGSVISLNPVNRTDAKVYTCEASNSVGSKTKSLTLTVQYAPEMAPVITIIEKCLTQSANIHCKATGIPTPDVSIIFGYHNLTSAKSEVNYTIQSLAVSQIGSYTCSASNAVGVFNASRFVTRPVTPGAVQSLALKASKGEFEVSWTAPICKGASGLKEYRVSKKKKAASSWEKNFTTTASPYKITDLEDGVEYTIGVAVVARSGLVGPYTEKTEKATNIKDPDSGERKDDKTAMIAGIAGGSVLFILILVLVIFLCKRRRRSSQAIEYGNGGVATSYGEVADKNKNDDIVMKDMNGDQVDHSVGPHGDLYAKVSKKGKSGNVQPAIAYGAVDNANFVAESDGAYDPVDVKAIKNDTPKASPATNKKVDGHYAELSSFRAAGDEGEKPKPNVEKTEYASIQDLGPLTPHVDEPAEETGPSSELPGTRIVVTPEKDDTGTNDSPDTDTASSRVNLI